MIVESLECHLKLEGSCGRYKLLLPRPVRFVMVYIHTHICIYIYILRNCLALPKQVTCVSMGNPHAVVFVPNLGDIPLETVGPKFETHHAFPAKTNTEFVQVRSREHLVMKVWERGAGPTQACGTGACAVVVAAVLNGLAERKCTVALPGGDLGIEWREGNGRVYMTGPAIPVFSGSAHACAAAGSVMHQI